jgi:hypothetical protein
VSELTSGTPESIAMALALMLAVDGYIDLDQRDGEAFIYGDDVTGARAISGTADELHKWLTMSGSELARHRAEVLGRRHREGRD